jgi:mRNA interferase RelE/StbE
MYTVELKPKANKFIKAQEKQFQRQLIEKIKSLADKPRPKNCKLLHSVERLYRIRLGDYRIIYQIDNAHKLVTVAWISHRKDAYRHL